MNIFDILVLGIVLLGALQGYRKGLISGLVSLVGHILGLVLAAKEYLKVLSWMDQNTPIRNWIEPAIYKLILPSIESKAQLTGQQTLERILSMFPKEIRDLIGNGNTPDFQAYTQTAIQTVAHNFSGLVTDNLLKIIAFGLTYSVIVLAVEILTSLILSPFGLFSGTVNRGGGFLVGALGSFVGLAVFVGLISPLITFAGTDSVWGLLPRSQSYTYLVQTFNYLGDILRLNLDQGFTLPLDFTKVTLPDLRLY